MPSQSDSTTDYAGPSAREMIHSHTLAHNIITRHDDAYPVLGPSELVLLRRFVMAPDTHHEILKDCDMLENPPTGELPRQGSLVGYIIANYEESDGQANIKLAMTAKEIADLKKWFESGAPDKSMEGGCETGKGHKDADGVWRD
ncbi:MAG: hypothetical protein Q9213_006852 [Squamulea squamosa]